MRCIHSLAPGKWAVALCGRLAWRALLVGFALKKITNINQSAIFLISAKPTQINPKKVSHK